MHRAVTSARLLALALVLVAGATLSAAGYTMRRLRADVIGNSLAIAALHSRSFEDFLTQSLRVTELATANAVSTPGFDGAASQISGALAASLRHAPSMRSMSLLSLDGRIAASTNPANVGKAVSTLSFLPPDARGTDLLRIGRPWLGRDFADGRPLAEDSAASADAKTFLPITQTLSDAGVETTLLVALNPDYFINHMSQKLSPAEGKVSILRYDGTMLMSTDPARTTGELARGLMRELHLPEVEAAHFERMDEEGRAVLVAFRASHLYPIVVVTELYRDQALAPWRTELRSLFMVLVPALLALTAVSIAFYRRQQLIVAVRAEADRHERLHATVYRASTDAIVITDRDAQVLSVNPAFTEMLGYQPDEVRGKNPRMWSSGQHDDAVYQGLWQALLRDGVWKGELINRRRDGSLFDAEVSINVSRDDQGEFQHFIAYITDVSKRKQAELDLRESEGRFRDLTHLSSDWYWEQDENFRFVRMDGDLRTLSGVAAQDHIGLTRWDMPALNLSDADWAAHKALLNAHQPFYNFEMRRPDHDGRRHWVSISGTPKFDAQGRFVGYRGVGSNITDRKLAEEGLTLAASVFTHSHEAIMITEMDGTIINVNEAFTRITRYAADEVIGRNPRLLSSGLQDTEFYAALWHSLIHQGHWYGEIWNRRKNGEIFAAMQTISAVRDSQGRNTHFVALFSDVTPLKEHERQLQRIAHFDSLTSLPNRMLLADRLQQGMAVARRSGRKLSVVFLDLDGFKAINDRHGHKAGDQLLVTLAARMKDVLRDTDTLARLGGDEFVAVLVEQTSGSASLPVLDRLLAAASQPVVVGDLVCQVSASLGVTFYPQAGDVDADQLLRQADQAMYQAKLAGKNRYHVFDAEGDQHLRDHHEGMDRIRRALQSQEFVLHYQPKVNLRTGEVVGAEALIRWQHPERGLLLPGAFLPDTNGSALGVEIGDWVIDTALAQIEAWQADHLDLPVSVNVSGAQLQPVDFMHRLKAALARHPTVSPDRLQMEVLETTALDDIEQVANIIRACRELGVTFALDDFGTGYSSLIYLRRLPVSQIKIDQTFVQGIVTDPDDLAILQGVLTLARAFRREVIAEGVETVEQGEALLRLGCELAQGYCIARPMPAAEMPAWCATWQTRPRWRKQPAIGPNDVEPAPGEMMDGDRAGAPQR